MNVRHENPDLDKLETDPEFSGGFDRTVVRRYRTVMMILRTVENETKIYNYKGLKFEKLKGDRSHQRSLRINRQWRLIVEIEDGDGGNTVVVRDIEDYH